MDKNEEDEKMTRKPMALKARKRDDSSSSSSDNDSDDELAQINKNLKKILKSVKKKGKIKSGCKERRKRAVKE